MTVTATVWGAGFVLNKSMIDLYFGSTPALLNSIRFCVALIALTVAFIGKLRFDKRTLLCGALGGVLLFCGFLLQSLTLKYTTPSRCGFFCACYVVFVPFIVWALFRHKPSWKTICGMLIAVIGLVILNLSDEQSTDTTLLGNMFGLACALMFGLQIVWADRCIKYKNVDNYNMTYWQVAFGAILFVIYSVIFEHPHYDFANVDWSFCWWRIAIVALGGTAFGYYSQTYAQQHLSPSETSLLMACESPIGAIISVIVGSELLTWNTVVGGLLIVCAVLVVEVLPLLIDKNKTNTQQPIPQENLQQTTETETTATE